MTGAETGYRMVVIAAPPGMRFGDEESIHVLMDWLQETGILEPTEEWMAHHSDTEANIAAGDLRIRVVAR